ncbi:MAG: M23 family metallopeptidase [Vulcanibacillus sp.]
MFIFLFFGIVVVGGIYYITMQLENRDEENNINNEPVQLEGEELNIYNFNDELMFSLDEFSSRYDLTWEYDSFEGIIKIYDSNHTYFLLKETPVIAVDGVYKPVVAIPYIKNNQVYLDLDILNKVFNYRYEPIKGQEVIEVFENGNLTDVGNSYYQNFENQFSNMTEQEMFSYLSFLSVPLRDAHLTSRDSQLPGAPRDYRNGYHEGIDWYEGTIGINISKNTPVISMANGVVVRADHDYIELNYEERDEILNISINSDHTPQYILDKLRGRSVWIQSNNGVMIRYAHLSRIESNIKLGDIVQGGQIIGYVGNSGTSYGIEGNDGGLHLHTDILIYNNLFWEHYNASQIRFILEALFSAK